MKKTLFAVITLMLSFSIQAQNEKIFWKDGPLVWEDFKVKNLTENAYIFSYHLGYNSSKNSINDTVVKQVLAQAYFLKDESFVNSNFKNDTNLRYLQVLFNILEINRRKMQRKFNNMQDFTDLSSAYDETNSECTREMEVFAALSDKGNRFDVIVEWEKETLAKLESLPENDIPKVDKKGFGYGMHGGFGASSFSGGLEDYFEPSFNIGFGFEIGYNRHMLFIEGLLGFTKNKQDYLEEGKWLEGNRANISVINLAYGYSIFDNKNLKITPFAGLGITEFTTEHENEVQEDYRFVDYNLAYGLQTDIKIRRKLNLIPNSTLNVKEYNESSIKIRLFMTQAKFNQDISGNTINLGVEYSVFGRFFK